MVRGVIGRPGGKTRLRKRIIPKIPPHNTYVEPFFGGGAIFFGKEPSQTEVINDKDHLVYGIHKAVKDGSFCCDLTPKREQWKDIYKRRDGNPGLSPCEQIYLIKNSFGQLGVSYSAVKNPKKRTPCFGMQHDRLRDTKILQQNAYDVIRDFDGEDTFFYVDPPYVDVCLYGSRKIGDPLCSITPDALAGALRPIQGKFLLSYNDHPKVRKAFDGFHITEVPMRYTGGKGRVGKGWEKTHELLISNYPVTPGADEVSSSSSPQANLPMSADPLAIPAPQQSNTL